MDKRLTMMLSSDERELRWRIHREQYAHDRHPELHDLLLNTGWKNLEQKYKINFGWWYRKFSGRNYTVQEYMDSGKAHKIGWSENVWADYDEN